MGCFVIMALMDIYVIFYIHCLDTFLFTYKIQFERTEKISTEICLLKKKKKKKKAKTRVKKVK